MPGQIEKSEKAARAARAAAKSSAAGKTATSFARASSVPFSSAIPARDLKNSRWAVPTPVTTPTSGSAMSQRAAISPGWFDPISTTRKSASSGQLRIVIGRPRWLLKFPSVACVFPAHERNVRSSSFVVVLPAEPVTPTTVALSARR